MNGKVERSQKTDKAEFIATLDLAAEGLDDQLALWQHYPVHSDQTRFAEIVGNKLALNAREGWLVVVRPDRVVMLKEAARLVRDSARMLLS